MEIIAFVFFGIIAVYSFFIGLLAYGFRKIPFFGEDYLEPKTNFSIMVPFRNEAANLPGLLHSFSQLNYPRANFEVVFVNDSSEDTSVEIITTFPAMSFGFQIIDADRKSNSPKKDAISTAVCILQNEWIITTDADCFVAPDWLKTLDSYIQNHNPEMIAGAVSFFTEDSFLHQFQQLDLMSLQGATIGSFGIKKAFMCNGANFAYTKSLFLDLNGFDGNSSIASGDDVFLLQKAVSRYPEKVHYLKSESNIVFTQPLEDWKSLFYQRVRWASKASSYQSLFGKVLALVVFAGNLGVVLSTFLVVFSRFTFLDWYLILGIKILIDFSLLYQTGKFIRPRSVKFFLVSNLIYPFFSVSVAFHSLFGKYEWKGRQFKN